MSSDDIANLYRQFGGQPDNYQELGRDNVIRQSRERWPLLANVRQQDAARGRHPVSQDGAPTDVAAGPLPTVFDERAAADAAARAAVTHTDVYPRQQPVRGRPALPTQMPVEPVMSADHLPPVAPPASYAPIASPAPAPARPGAPAAGTELQGLFTRIARAPEPPASSTDRDGSILRRLLRS